MPGRIIQSLKKVKSSNPVFVLDEIDKVAGMNISGDPRPHCWRSLIRNRTRHSTNNFLEVEFNLSRVMFIATANTLATVHPALRDRMEVIELPGYLLEEKLEIAKRHLVPKQIREHGMKKTQLTFNGPVIQKIIEEYTRESGVRALEKNIAKIIRYKAKSIVTKEKFNRIINATDLKQILGVPVFQAEKYISNEIAGVVTGLAWTATGGEILFVEVSLSTEKGT